MALINTRLMKHPINWLTILLMLLIAALFGHYLLTMFDQQPSLPRVTPNLTPDPTPSVQPV